MQSGKVIFYNLDRWNFQEFYQKLCSQDPLKIFITTDLRKHLLSCPLVLMCIYVFHTNLVLETYHHVNGPTEIKLLITILPVI